MATKTTPVEPEIPQTVNINGEEYSVEDAQNYIQKGRQTADLEKQWNTSVDKVWPEYGKLTEAQKQWQTEKEGYETKLKDFEAKQNAGVETTADVTAAKEAARKLGLILNEDLDKAGYIKADQLDSILDQRLIQRDEVKKILDTADGLEKQINGSDGRPKFNKRAVLAYASAYNIPDLTQAYEDMNKDDIEAWKTRQITSQRNKGISTFTPGGTKNPANVKVTKENFHDLFAEATTRANE